MIRIRPRTAFWLFLLWTALGLLFFTSYYLDDLARRHYGTAPHRLIEELTGAYTALVLMPGVIWAARRARLTKERWPTALPLLALAALAYSFAHTSLMAITRAVLFPLFRQGPYDYGIMVYRYPMEAAKDVMVFAIVCGCVYFLERLERGRRAEIAAAELQTTLARTRLENLRLQLHPHFLFNTLNAISSVMYEDPAKADEMLAKLSDFLRTILDTAGVQDVAMLEELRIERLYVDIMRTRLEQPLRLDVEVSDDAREAAIPFMLLQPLLENSIRHGTNGSPGGLNVRVGVRRQSEATLVEVSDNGSGYRPNGGAGHGLRNVASRLEHEFGDRASFAIENRAEGGTRVVLRFPYARA